MDKYKIFCCTHVPTKTVDDRLYKVLQTGVDFDGDVFPNMLHDNTGDNISALKDKYDGYLTGMYWIWKNTCYEYVGLCGYRAYLGKDKNNPLRYEDVVEIFENGKVDIIVLCSNLIQSSVEEQFKEDHKLFYYNDLHNPLKYIKDILEEYFPSYVKAYETTMLHNQYNYRHSFVAKKEYYDQYCEWLFAVLEKYNEYLKNKKYPISERFFGNVVERLERVWLMNQKLKIKEVPVVFVSKRNIGL